MSALTALVAILISGDGGVGDASRGASLYVARCGACHSLGENGAGPSHQKLWGRKAATQPGFDYSAALRASKIVWNEKTLDRWLTNPNELVPGNKMMVQLASDPIDRADLIAFLRRETR
ncbi:MAG: c-type cytochrome [Archangium sp.]|nr:c-type cytochrome [Archangium sp.]